MHQSNKPMTSTPIASKTETNSPPGNLRHCEVDRRLGMARSAINARAVSVRNQPVSCPTASR